MEQAQIRKLLRIQSDLQKLIEEVSSEEKKRRKSNISSPVAIMRVLYDKKRAMSASEISSELASRNQLPGGARPTQAVRVALSRLVASSKVQRIGTGAYQLNEKKYQEMLASAETDQ